MMVVDRMWVRAKHLMYGGTQSFPQSVCSTAAGYEDWWGGLKFVIYISREIWIGDCRKGTKKKWRIKKNEKKGLKDICLFSEF